MRPDMAHANLVLFRKNIYYSCSFLNSVNAAAIFLNGDLSIFDLPFSSFASQLSH